MVIYSDMNVHKISEQVLRMVMELQLWLAAAMAAIVTVTVRLTVFGPDCNLLVVGVTFLSAFGVIYLVMKIIRCILDRR